MYDGKTPECHFQVNNVTYKHGYYLVDGIFPEWATFVKSFTCPTGDKRQMFKTAQESARKDIEQPFLVIKQCWHIIHHPARAWHSKKLRNIMYTCIILHNIILEDEGNAICGGDYEPYEIKTQINAEQRATNVREVRNPEKHHALRADLVDHI